MTDPAPETRRYVPLDFARKQRTGTLEAPSGFGLPGPLGWQLPTPTARLDRALAMSQLRAAVVQHLFVQGLRRQAAAGPDPLSLHRVAASSRDRWRRTLAGHKPMSLQDVGTIALTAPDGWPDPSAVHATVALAEASVSDGDTKDFPAGAMRLAGVDERIIMTSLALGDGPYVTVLPPLTDQELAAEKVILSEVPGLLARTVPALAEEAGLATADEAAGWSVDLHHMTAQVTDRPEAAGALTRTGDEVCLRLRGDWPERVLEPGWAVLDGRFVLDVLPYRDYAGRPSRATVLAVVPDYVGAESDPDEDPCFVYREADVAIAWDAGEAVLTFTEPPRL